MTDASRSPRRGRRRIVALVIVLAVVAALLVAAELVVRQVVGNVAATEIERALPSAVSAEVTATTTGSCVLCEVVVGSISGLEVRGEQVTVGELTGTVDALAEQLTIREPITIGALNGTVHLGAEELDRMLREVATNAGIPYTGLEFVDGGIAYTAEITAFGVTTSARITANLEIRSGGRVQIVATGMELGGAGVNYDNVLDPSRFSLEFCAAEYLPEVFQLAGIELNPDGVNIGVRTTGPVTADEATFAVLGSCK